MGGDQGGELPRYRSHYPGLPAPQSLRPCFFQGSHLGQQGRAQAKGGALGVCLAPIQQVMCSGTRTGRVKPATHTPPHQPSPPLAGAQAGR